MPRWSSGLHAVLCRELNIYSLGRRKWTIFPHMKHLTIILTKCWSLQVVWLGLICDTLLLDRRHECFLYTLYMFSKHASCSYPMSYVCLSSQCVLRYALATKEHSLSGCLLSHTSLLCSLCTTFYPSLSHNVCTLHGVHSMAECQFTDKQFWDKLSVLSRGFHSCLVDF